MSPVGSRATQLSADNPWPGLASFGEGDWKYFHGRAVEVVELSTLVLNEPLTVLFGRSGLGKTSLLNAGLFPLLRGEDYLPVYIRLDHSNPEAVRDEVRAALGPAAYPGRDYRRAASLRMQVSAALSQACAAHGVEAPAYWAEETLWQFFHRSDAEFWSARNRPITPVLVFDQFEEMFTVVQSDAEARDRAEAFVTELGDLIENRAPAHLKSAMEGNAELGRAFDFRVRPVKVVLSFREDFLAEMEGLKRRVPSLMHNRFRLKPMTGEQAREVVIGSAAALVDEDVARRIIGLAGRGKPEPPPTPEEFPHLEIDPALLSVVCSELNAKRQRANAPTITADLLAGAEREILTDFYERGFAGLDSGVRVMVENNLLTASGFRNSYARDDALAEPGVTAGALDALVERRLVREEERFGVRRLELTHDVLTGVVRESRDRRKARQAEEAALARLQEAARRQQRNRHLTAVLCLAIVFVISIAWYVWDLRGQAGQLLREAETTRLQADAARLLVFADRLGVAQTDRALLLIAQANRILPGPDTKGALLQRLTGVRFLEAYLPAKAPPLIVHGRGVAFSPDDKVLAAAGANGVIVLWDVATRKEIASLAGHKDSVYHMAFSPDGKILATASMDKTVILWNVADRTLLATLAGHEGEVNHVAFGPDGRILASAGDDRSIVLWDIATRARITTLKEHEDAVFFVAFSPDGTILASSGKQSAVILWDVRTGARIASLERHKGDVLEIAFSPDGRTLASAGSDSTVILWDLATRKQRAVLEGHKRVSGLVAFVAFAPDGKTLAAVSVDHSVILWDVAAATRIATLEGHKDPLYRVAFSPDGRTLASASADGSVILWDVEERTRVATLEGHKGTVYHLTFSRDGKSLASASKDDTAILWNVAGRARLASLDGHQDEVTTVTYAHDGKTLASASKDGVVILWDVSTRGRLASMAHKHTVNGIAFSPDGRILASASADRTVALLDATTRTQLATLDGHKAAVNGIAFAPDGKTLASASDDRTVILWDVARMEAVGKLDGHQERVHRVAYAPNGQILAAATTDGQLIFWDVPTRKPLAVPQGHKYAVSRMVFARDGKTLASASFDKTVLLWDAAARKQLGSPLEHADFVNNIEFTPDGRILASASDDRTVALWDVVTRRRAATLEGHKGGVYSLAFAGDGKILASASDDRTVILWDIAGGARLATLEAHKDSVNDVAFSADGKTFASASRDRTVVLWNWEGTSLAEAACRTVNRNLTCDEWRQYVGNRPYEKTCPALPAPEKACQ